MRLRIRPTSISGAIVFTVTVVLAGCVPGGKPAEEPSFDPTTLQKEVIAKLSGFEEIKPGLKLPNRAALENKQAARAYLEEVWKGLGLEVHKHDYSPEGENLYAIVKARKPSGETIIVGAHYDTVRNTPGANDNATGVALVTAAAAEFSRKRPQTRDILFVLFDEEERGLRGSRAFAQKLVADLVKIHSVHTVDQMGWDKDGDRTVELEIPYEGAVELYGQAAKTMPTPIPLLVTKEMGSDHTAFRRLGFPAVGVTEEYRNGDTTPHIHRPGDAYETIQFDYLASTTRLVVKVLRLLTE